MSFKVSSVTNAGLDLIAAASSTDNLVIDNVICISVELPEVDILDKPVDYFLNHASRNTDVTAEVVSAGIDPNTEHNSRIVISFKKSSDTSNGTVKTIIVTGHSLSVTAGGSTEVTFYGLSDDVGLEIPYNEKTDLITQLSISFAFSRDSSIVIGATTPNYLLASETSRFVTTHSVNSATAGDEQVIYGHKTFSSWGTTFQGSLYLEQNNTNYLELSVDSVENAPKFVTQGSLVFDAGGAVSSIDSDGFWTNGVYTDLIASNHETYIRVSSNLIPDADSSFTLGNETLKFGFGYFQNLTGSALRTSAITAENNDSIQLKSSVTKGPGEVSLGEDANRFTAIYGTEIVGSSIKTSSLSAFGISGLNILNGTKYPPRPYPNEQQTKDIYPIGSIIMASAQMGAFEGISSKDDTVMPGMKTTSTSNYSVNVFIENPGGNTMYGAKLNEDGMVWVILQGLSMANETGSQSLETRRNVLVQRII